MSDVQYVAPIQPPLIVVTITIPTPISIPIITMIIIIMIIISPAFRRVRDERAFTKGTRFRNSCSMLFEVRTHRHIFS